MEESMLPTPPDSQAATTEVKVDQGTLKEGESGKGEDPLKDEKYTKDGKSVNAKEETESAKEDEPFAKEEKPGPDEISAKEEESKKRDEFTKIKETQKDKESPKKDESAKDEESAEEEESIKKEESAKEEECAKEEKSAMKEEFAKEEESKEKQSGIEEKSIKYKDFWKDKRPAKQTEPAKDEEATKVVESWEEEELGKEGKSGQESAMEEEQEKKKKKESLKEERDDGRINESAKKTAAEEKEESVKQTVNEKGKESGQEKESGKEEGPGKLEKKSQQRSVQEVLDSCRAPLVNSIGHHIEPILDQMLTDNVIDRQEYDKIKKIKSTCPPQDCARELLDYIIRTSYRSHRAYVSLKTGMTNIKLEEHVHMLEEAEKDTPRSQTCQTSADSEVALESADPDTSKHPPQRHGSNTTVEIYLRRTTRVVENDDFENPPELDCAIKLLSSIEGIMSPRSKKRFGKERSGSDETCSIMHPVDGAESKTRVCQESNRSLPAQEDEQFDIPPTQTEDVNLLLVGCKGNGKSSTGNTIIGENVFSVKKKGGTERSQREEVCCRAPWDKTLEIKVGVTDTPGVSEQMTESEFKELEKAVKKTPEGFDAIVLVWSNIISSLHEDKENNVFQSLQRMFGNSFCKHLFIVVTGTTQDGVSEFCIELPGSLKTIKDQCLNILAVDNMSKNLSEGSIWELIHGAMNNSKKYERYTKEHLSEECQLPPGDELRIALIGNTGAGKSSTANSIVGEEEFKVTTSASSTTKKCSYRKREKDDREIAVADSPGLWDTRTAIEDVCEEVTRIVTMFSEGLHALLLVIAVGKFTMEKVIAVQILKQIFGDNLMKYVVTVITRRDEIVEGDVKEYIKTAPPELKDLLNNCGYRYVAFDNKTKDETVKRKQLKELVMLIDDTVRKNGGVPFTNRIFQEGQKQNKKIMEEIIEEVMMRLRKPLSPPPIQGKADESYWDEINELTTLVHKQMGDTQQRGQGLLSSATVAWTAHAPSSTAAPTVASYVPPSAATTSLPLPPTCRTTTTVPVPVLPGTATAMSVRMLSSTTTTVPGDIVSSTATTCTAPKIPHSSTAPAMPVPVPLSSESATSVHDHFSITPSIPDTSLVKESQEDTVKEAELQGEDETHRNTTETEDITTATLYDDDVLPEQIYEGPSYETEKSMANVKGLMNKVESGKVGKTVKEGKSSEEEPGKKEQHEKEEEHEKTRGSWKEKEFGTKAASEEKEESEKVKSVKQTDSGKKKESEKEEDSVKEGGSGKDRDPEKELQETKVQEVLEDCRIPLVDGIGRHIEPIMDQMLTDKVITRQGYKKIRSMLAIKSSGTLYDCAGELLDYIKQSGRSHEAYDSLKKGMTNAGLEDLVQTLEGAEENTIQSQTSQTIKIHPNQTPRQDMIQDQPEGKSYRVKHQRHERSTLPRDHEREAQYDTVPTEQIHARHLPETKKRVASMKGMAHDGKFGKAKTSVQKGESGEKEEPGKKEQLEEQDKPKGYGKREEIGEEVASEEKKESNKVKESVEQTVSGKEKGYEKERGCEKDREPEKETQQRSVQETLDSCRAALVDGIGHHIEPILDQMLTDKVISGHGNEKIKSMYAIKSTGALYDCAGELLDDIKQSDRRREAYDALKKGMTNAGLKELVKTLENAEKATPQSHTGHTSAYPEVIRTTHHVPPEQIYERLSSEARKRVGELARKRATNRSFRGTPLHRIIWNRIKDFVARHKCW